MFKLNANQEQTPTLNLCLLLSSRPVFQNHFQTSVLPHRTSTLKTHQMLLYQMCSSISSMAHQDVSHISTGKSVSLLVVMLNISLLSKLILSKLPQISESSEDIKKISKQPVHQTQVLMLLMMQFILLQQYHSNKLAFHQPQYHQSKFHP